MTVEAVPVVSYNQVEAALIGHLKTWLPRYLGEGAKLDGIVVRQDAVDVMPKRWGRIDDWPTGLIADPLPRLYVISAGTLADGGWDDTATGVRVDLLDVKVAVIVPGEGHGDMPASAGRAARLYAWALQSLLLQQPGVSASVAIEAVGAAEFAQVSQDTASTLGLVVVNTTVAAALTALTPLWMTDPTTPVPPAGPTADAPDLPVIADEPAVITVEHT